MKKVYGILLAGLLSCNILLAQTLQSVTDNGNTTTNHIQMLSLSLYGQSIGFNRNTPDGTIFSNALHAYQFQHTGSSNAAADVLALQVYRPDGQFVTPVALVINGDGNIGIGTHIPGSYKLAVEGTIGARKVRVTQASWADYVFDSSYRLLPLHQVEKYIKENKHLPDVPSTATVIKEGIDIGDNQAILLRKIEELTLYIIQQQKDMEKQQKEMQELKEQVVALKREK